VLEKEKVSGKYYLNNFADIKFKFIRKISSKKKDCKNLNRLVTGYSYTRLFLYRMRLVESPICKCNTAIQDINHIFWACPILVRERKEMYKILRDLKQVSFSIEYLLGKLNRKIAAIIYKYIKKTNSKLEIFL